jgi:hypothetical protein
MTDIQPGYINLWSKTYWPEWPLHGLLLDPRGRFSIEGWAYSFQVDAMTPYIHAFLMPRTFDTTTMEDPEGMPLPAGFVDEIVAIGSVRRQMTSICSDGEYTLSDEPVEQEQDDDEEQGTDASQGPVATPTAGGADGEEEGISANGAGSNGPQVLSGAVTMALAFLLPRYW